MNPIPLASNDTQSVKIGSAGCCQPIIGRPLFEGEESIAHSTILDERPEHLSSIRPNDLLSRLPRAIKILFSIVGPESLGGLL
jgi:hypothetical protein